MKRPYKAFLLFCTQERGALHDYEQILQQRKRATQNQALPSTLVNKPGVGSYARFKLRHAD